MRPWIGITTYHRETEGRPRFSLPSSYLDAVRSAGGRAVLLAPGEPAPETLLDRLDGLVLSGGGDLAPDSSGSGEHPSVYFVSPERDAFEVSLVRAALARRLPLLAICRGMQVLNVALGGDIHVHVPDVVGEAVAHRRSQDEAVSHPVSLAPGSRLAALFGSQELASVPSWHHQAVNRLGRDLRPVAWAADGIVEALEHGASPEVLAVQWHPELENGPTAPGGLLFARHLEQATLRQQGGNNA